MTGLPGATAVPEAVAHRTRRQRMLALLLIVGLLYAGGLLVKDVLASLSAVPALQLMQHWERERYSRSNEAMEGSAVGMSGEASQELAGEVAEPPAFVPDPGEWELARSAMERAVALAPGNPEWHANLGRLLQFRFEDDTLPLEESVAYAERALVSFRQAARLRPTWSYHWWDIARTEYVLQRAHTEDFIQALDNSVRFGPWLEDVQLFAADLALEQWRHLGPDSRTIALANLDRALQRNPEITPGIVSSYDAWPSVCTSLGERGSSAELVQLAAYCADPSLREAPPVVTRSADVP